MTTNKCSMCGSMAINPGLHGRPTTGGEPAIHSDLCDVCYWRVSASTWKQLYDMQKEQNKQFHEVKKGQTP